MKISKYECIVTRTNICPNRQINSSICSPCKIPFTTTNEPLKCRLCDSDAFMTVRYEGKGEPFAICEKCKDLKNSGPEGVKYFISMAWKREKGNAEK